MYVQPFDGSLAQTPLSSLAGGVEGEAPPFGGAAAPPASDNISRFVPPWFNDGAAAMPYGDDQDSNPASLQGLFGPLMGVLQQLMQMLQSLMGYGGCGTPNGGSTCSGGACRPYGKEQFFRNASASSEGDPHLRFDGARWNSMASHPDLLNSNSFAGGFRISTQVTPPNGNGVTWNQSATVSMNGGRTTVGMNGDGQPSIVRDGESIAITRGQTVHLGDGESVTYERNGSLVVDASNGMGGRIETTLAAQDGGVNVDVSAHDVDLGGALVNGYEHRDDGE